MPQSNEAFNYECDKNYEKCDYLEIGKMSVKCKHCDALTWKHEPAGLCCSNGKVRIPKIAKPPEPLASLLLGDTPDSRSFLKRIRVYNSLFTMTSFIAHEVQEDWQPTIRIQGKSFKKYSF